MKKLPQTIESCHQCPYYRQERDYRGIFREQVRVRHVCDYSFGGTFIIDPVWVPFGEQQTRLNEIPDWCPLEDA